MADEREPLGGGPPPRPPSRGRLNLLAAALSVAVVAALAWYAYERGTAPEGGEVPLIEADEGPTKKRPEDPGGLVVPDQDKLIYEALENEGGEEGATVERLLPPPEEPMPPPPTPEFEPSVEGIEAPPPASEAPAVPAPEVPSPEPADAAPPEPAETPPPEPTQAPPPEPAQAPPPEPAQAPPSGEASPAGAGYFVQLASFREIADADAAWRRLVKAHRALLGGLTARVERADLGGDRGVFYRLRAGPVAGPEAAERLCAALEARDVDCLVVTP